MRTFSEWLQANRKELGGNCLSHLEIRSMERAYWAGFEGKAELLEALRQIADPMGWPVSLTPEEFLIQIRRRAHAAIARAEGREP